MQESPSRKHIVIYHWCFFCVLVIMIRSCLAKQDNKGVHKGTECLASSQLNLSWPALLAWTQEHTAQCLSGHTLPFSCRTFHPSAPQELPEHWTQSDFSPIFMWVHQFMCKAEVKPHLSVPVLSQSCLSLPSFPPHQPALPVLKKEGTVLLKRDRRALL